VSREIVGLLAEQFGQTQLAPHARDMLSLTMPRIMTFWVMRPDSHTASSDKCAARVTLSRPNGRRFGPTSAAYGDIAAD
jgi:hypothetical protein